METDSPPSIEPAGAVRADTLRQSSVQVLIEEGKVSANKLCNGVTPWMPPVQVLIEEGKVSANKLCNGLTPLDAATRSYYWSLVYLVPPNASTDHAIQVQVEEGKVSANELCNGLTPLDAARRSHNEATLSYLNSILTILILAKLSRCKSRRARSQPMSLSTLSPLGCRHKELLLVLVEEGKVSANELCNGLTPLDAAMRSHNEATLSYLKSVGGVSSRDLAQQSVSVSAAEEEERDVVDKYTEHVKQAHEKKAADAAEDQKTEL
eukprot:gene2683-12916_t